MGYRLRLLILIAVDSLIVFFSIFLGYWLLTPTNAIIPNVILISATALLFSHHFYAYFFKLYHRAWSYASIQELIAIVKAVSFSIFTVGIIQLILFQHLYVKILFITLVLHILFIGASRFAWRLFRDRKFNGNKNRKPTLIIGAGEGGNLVARQLLNSETSELYPVGFVDDDDNKQNLRYMGRPVLGKTKDIEKIVSEKNIEHIVIAIPSLKKEKLNEIFLEASKTKVRTQILPSVEDIMSGKVTVKEMRDVEVEDLLGRDPVELDIKSIRDKLCGKTVLVTGAGGSIGSEVCRQVAQFNPKKLILLGHGENSIYNIELELKGEYDNIEIVTEIADIQDKPRIEAVMEQHKPHVVYHAAAHKHVPLMERNPHEAVKNNVVGTKIVAEAASKANVESFVMISTDKAVNPTSVMGATKRMAEMIVQHMNNVSKTKFVAVRFGNVLGSRGSVIPLFKKQIAKGGPVTVTHPDMERYFMTIPEASRLVLQAGALAQGGEVFVLDMGEPVKIVDLAKNLIRLSGYTEEEIEITFTGIRPGEKLYEELLGEDEVHEEQIYPMIYRGKTSPVNVEVIYDFIEQFHAMSNEMVREKVLDIAHFRVEQLTELTAVK